MITKASFCVLPIFVLVLLTLPSRASDANQAEFDLPRPNGCHPVGTRTIVLRDPRRSRDLLVTMWYPAMESTPTLVPYMDKKTADAPAEECRVQPNFQRLVLTHARLQALLAERGPFPVVRPNTDRVSCPPSKQFWRRVWQAAASSWSPPINPPGFPDFGFRGRA